ncbi:excalibur calcium-binding domain-containing protein [Spirillospora albida]|uniref:excalibur calcium-binding domain-containing protein n=1 Tax=Spirillospora albida TaxID=58123 RepID=UPI003CCB954E
MVVDTPPEPTETPTASRSSGTPSPTASATRTQSPRVARTRTPTRTQAPTRRPTKTSTRPTVRPTVRPTTKRPVRTTPPRPSTDPRFSTCAEANRAGFGPYHQGKDPEYSWYQDRDDDGVVCEPR